MPKYPSNYQFRVYVTPEMEEGDPVKVETLKGSTHYQEAYLVDQLIFPDRSGYVYLRVPREGWLKFLKPWKIIRLAC